MTRLFRALAFIILIISAPVALSAQGMVSSADPRATEAGQEMLRAGGSAADAAMAMMLVLTVVEPQSSGIGGGGFFLYHDQTTGKMATIDGREKAPKSATPERFLGPDGKPRGFRDIVPGGLSVGVPGNIRLMEATHKKWGKLPWAKIFDPAIRISEEGFVVNKTLNRAITMMGPLWKDFPEMRALYFVNGQPAPRSRRILHWPECAGNCDRRCQSTQKSRRYDAGGFEIL
jgi:gamma-glutamyltranspeptidase / glutathione hydrolase